MAPARLASGWAVNSMVISGSREYDSVGDGLRGNRDSEAGADRSACAAADSPCAQPAPVRGKGRECPGTTKTLSCR